MTVYYERTYPFAERTKAKGEEVRQEFNAVESGLSQVSVDIKRALKLPSGFDVELEANDDLRAGKVLGFDSEGNPVLQQGVGRWRGNYAVSTDYAERDIFKDSEGVLGQNNIYIVIEAFTSADLSTETGKIETLLDLSDVEAFSTAAEAAKDAAETASSDAEQFKIDAAASAVEAEDSAAQAYLRSLSALNSSTSAGSKAGFAEEWANKAEDSLISTDAGGNGADDYSARHWSIKSEDSAEASAISAVNAAASAEAVENERIEWVPGGYDPERIYIYNEAFSHEGSSYIVIKTAQGITPPNNAYYDVIASRGPAGAGTGDMLSENNLSDVDDAGSARSNLNINATNTPFDSSGTPLSATNVKTAIAESITRLGTAATTNKQTAVTDSTAGRLLIVGAMANLLGFSSSGTGLYAGTVQAAIAELAGNYTAADVLTKLLTVDGAGSGLDADRLDGQHGSYYLAANAYTAADILTKLLTVDGAGSGLDADRLDGQDSAFFRDASNLNSGTVPSARLPAPSTAYQAVYTYKIYTSNTVYTVGSTSSVPGPGTWRNMGLISSSSEASSYLWLRIA